MNHTLENESLEIFFFRSESKRKLEIDKTWAFADCTQKQTRYLSHSYHTYPAKFIPQLAARLIKEFSQENDIVVDPFMGSGTTVVEALIHGRVGVGVDINPIAALIAKVKSTPVEPSQLQQAFRKLEIATISRQEGHLFAPDIEDIEVVIPQLERLDYWFLPAQKEQLSLILAHISRLTKPEVRDFFLVAFSQILKSCSLWLQKSVKPSRDLNKVLPEPVKVFLHQARTMMKKNQEFYNILPTSTQSNLEKLRQIKCSDARRIPLPNEAATLVVTSPPYVTSYEYADLHQLTALWLEYCDSVGEFRKPFIGSAYSERATIDLQSPLADDICKRFGKSKKGQEVRNYFADMLECFAEMKRVLKKGGKAGVVIGNTTLKGIPILNAQVFVEQMQYIGFSTFEIIKREIPSKILPQTRDPKSGRFTSSANSNKVLAYPVEYILIMEKQ